MYPRIYSPRSKYKDLPNLSKIIKNYSFRLASFLCFCILTATDLRARGILRHGPLSVVFLLARTLDQLGTSWHVITATVSHSASTAEYNHHC